MSQSPGSKAKKAARSVAKRPKAKSLPPRPDGSGPNRRTTARQYRIFKLIERGEFPTSTRICAEIGCSRASFFRDLDYMKLDLELPIEFDQERNGYYLSKPVGSFPSMYVTSGELISLLLAHRSFERTRNAAFGPQIHSAMDKLGVAMDDAGQALLAEMDELVSFRSSAIEVLTDVDTCVKVFDALLAREELELLYWKLDAPAPVPKRLRPVHLLCVDSTWYLFALDPALPDAPPRKYLLSRMSELRRTGTKFRRPKNFRVEEMLAHSIGVYGGEHPERLHLRLESHAARWFGERRFHATQRFIAHPDGSAELTMDVAIDPELERLILGWGAQAEVLTPLSLRETIWKEAEAIYLRGRIPQVQQPPAGLG